ncbi:unnamed protein product [Arctia plantaginis]|uniref:Uncharacterized protein n=1 Tax=Arctia plantaginis TaxID=874455 RepID=A0A8S1BI73_ARCPL|nr:unnamed protein product [Arctia plantaginis]
MLICFSESSVQFQVYLILLVTLCAVAGEETHPGLVTKNSEHDLLAEASQSETAQKREGSLSNSYGEPLPPDAYGPPKDQPNTSKPTILT